MAQLNFTSGTFNGWKQRMRGRIYGVLCEREKNGEWKKFLDNIVLELLGWQENLDSINYWALLGKLQAARKMIEYEDFRSLIFECINMMEGVNHERVLSHLHEKDNAEWHQPQRAR